LLARWRAKLAGDAGAKIALRMIDMLGANPFATARGVEQRLGIAYNTAIRAIGQLEQQGIVKEISGAKRDRVFCAKKLLDILEEPAQLTPAGKS
jgi:Fic family protein